MSKRNPTSELNHDNWNEDEEKEEAGHFKVAAEDVIKKREIRVAKRRNLGGEDSGTGGLFKTFTGFSGFGSSAGPATAAPAFSFGANKQSQETQQPPQQQQPQKNGKESRTNEQHLSQLKALNQCVLNWIRTHVTENPYCVLTPVFKDYERHLAEIERKYPYVEEGDADGASAKASSVTAGDAAAAPSAVPGIGGFKFSSGASGGAASSKESSASKPAPTFSFAASSAASSAAPAPLPSFNFAGSTASQFVFNAAKAVEKDKKDEDKAEKKDGKEAEKDGKETEKKDDREAESKKDDKAPAASLFGFSFKPTGAPAAPSFLLGGGGSQQQQQQQEDEEYEPPKPETREIKEAGAVYTKRCKLFYLVPDTKEWREKGVGNLHVKPSDGKAQLVVRADNTLGTILLNTIVNKQMSLTATKNNVNFACVPNPPLKLGGKDKEEPKLVSFLIKVKTVDDAEELVRHLDEQRGK